MEPRRSPAARVADSKRSGRSDSKRSSSSIGSAQAAIKRTASELSSRSSKLKHMAHRGHGNIRIRAIAKVGDLLLTLTLVAASISVKVKVATAVLQSVSALTLFVQWRTARPSMFIVRATSNFITVAVQLYALRCGGEDWPGEDCADYPQWDDTKQLFKMLAIANVLKTAMNGISLLLHFRFPYRMFAGRGCWQLFWRGYIQAFGVPVTILIGCFKMALLPDYENKSVDVFVHFASGLATFPVSSWSLFYQWYLTRKGATGHARSDAHERDLCPDTHNPLESVRVTVRSAKDLYNADWVGKSDPFCVVEVVGRPESTWQTKTVWDDLDPVWEESRELLAYRLGDQLEFTVYDYDEPPFCLKGIHYFADRKDFLGKVTLDSSRFHPHGFDGEVSFDTHPGKHRHPTITLKVEILSGRAQPTGGLVASTQSLKLMSL